MLRKEEILCFQLFKLRESVEKIYFTMARMNSLVKKKMMMNVKTALGLLLFPSVSERLPPLFDESHYHPGCIHPSFEAISPKRMPKDTPHDLQDGHLHALRHEGHTFIIIISILLSWKNRNDIKLQ
ncbi:hypothetical protein ACJX0J_029962, partial [Zea mays]